MSLPLVLLPGMMCDARLFGPQIAALSGTYPIHCAPITGAETIEDLASSVLAHAPPRFALAGLSMGGIVAMEIMAQAPERVVKLALMDTNPKAELPEIKAKRALQLDKVRAGGLASVMRDEMKPNYLADAPNKRETLDLCMAMALDLGADVFIRQSIALRDRIDRQRILRDVSVPTLVLCGREEQLCPLERHELMHDLIPNSRLAVIEGAAHLPTLEQPDTTTAELARWLTEGQP